MDEKQVNNGQESVTEIIHSVSSTNIDPSEEFVEEFAEESTGDNTISEPPTDEPPKKEKSSNNNKHIALAMAATIALSGVAGYGGGYLANKNAPIKSYTSSASTLATTPANTGDVLSVVQVADMNQNSVVEITTERASRDSFFGQYVSEGAGSGIVISSDGYIMTNNHVIDDASKIQVRLKDGTSYEATLVGKDSVSDIAVIKVNATNLTPVVYGDSQNVAVGETAIAIGNPLGELGGTVTQGIVSALDRDILIGGEHMNLMQTSAAVNPGNSGGGLFNSQGELIGVVSAKSLGTDVEGIGFAIPVDTAKEVAEQLISDGYVKGRIRIGISLVEINDAQTASRYNVTQTGVYVMNIEKENGFKAGDRIVSADGQAITSATQLKEIINAHQPGDKMQFQIDRNGNTFDLSVTLEEYKG